jgi:putative flippase GtrA
MPEELTSTVELPAVELPSVELPSAGELRVPLHLRVRHGVRKTHNWKQLIRFVTVGASGYIVNLAVFTVCVSVAGIDYRLGSVIAFIVSVINNFWLNRHWTFDARDEHPMFQGVRFFAVSLLAYGVQLLVLIGLVEVAGLSKVISQAIAIVTATPLSFLGQKLWSFKA